MIQDAAGDAHGDDEKPSKKRKVVKKQISDAAPVVSSVSSLKITVPTLVPHPEFEREEVEGAIKLTVLLKKVTKTDKPMLHENCALSTKVQLGKITQVVSADKRTGTLATAGKWKHLMS